MPLDLKEFKSTPPYASELLGVYKPLLGWKSRQGRERVAAASSVVFKKAIERFARDRRVERAVLTRPRPVEPDDRFPVRFPDWGGSLVMSKVADALGQSAAGADGVNWEEAVKSADLGEVVAAMGRAMEAAQVEAPAQVAVLDAARVPSGRRRALGAQALRGTKLLIAQVEDGELPKEWQVKNHGLVFLRKGALSDAELAALQAEDVRGTDLVATAALAESAAGDLSHEAALAGTLGQLAERDPELLSSMLVRSPAWRYQLTHVDPFPLFKPWVRQAVLSPLATVDVYREYFFEFDTFLGPPVAHVWVSPGGGVELYEVHTRRLREERETEISEELTMRTEREIGEEDELSTAVGEENSRDIKMGVSVNGSVNFGVVQAGGEANLALDLSRKSSQQEAHKHARRQTEKLTNEIRKSFKTTFRTTTESEDVSSRRYVLQNDTDKLVNYELRRKMRRVGVQLQHIGTMLCWQVHIYDPGAELGVAELVHVAQPDDFESKVPPPEAPPVQHPRQTEHTVEFPYESLNQDDDENDVTYYKGDDHETGWFEDRDHIVWQREFKLPPPAAGYKLADVKQLSADRVDPDEDPPSVAARYTVIGDDTFRLDLEQVNFNEQPAIRFALQAIWNPPDNSAEQQEYEKRLAQYTERKQREAQAELVRAARERIKLASGIGKRRSEELRDEERTAIFRRMMTQLTKVQVDPGHPHVTAELVRSIFDVDKMLYFVAPEWWQPRRRTHQELSPPRHPSPVTDADTVGWGGSREAGRDNYPITEDSVPAPLGASLGWLLQLDGDNHRNMFLNASWALAVLPVREGKELDALDWLKLEEVEGVDGLDATYSGSDPDLRGKTLDEVLKTLAAKLQEENTNVENVLAGEKVYEKGFDPLEGGFETGKPFKVFDQWVEILPTDQVVATEYDANQ